MSRFCFGLMKFLIIVENVIVALLATGLIYVSISAVDKDHGMDTLNDSHPKVVHNYISLISAGVGIIILLLSSLGLFGALTKSKTLLYMYAGIVFSMIFILAVIAGITLTIRTSGAKYKDVDKGIINETIAIYKHAQPEDIKTRLLDQLQERLQCCGINSPNDWKDFGQHKIAKSCCINRIESSITTLTTTSSSVASTNQTGLPSFKYCEQSDYKIGCWPALTDYFHANLSAVRSMLYVIIGVGLVSSICAFFMSRTIKQRLEVV